jgi:tRNA threonylcarbamoyladenosine biosynthesis protein TsaB
MALVLAFDTATHVATVAVLRNGDVLGERVTRSHRVLLDAQELLTEAGADTNDLTALVVGIGPGSFTGVRLGLAAARGLALARDLPVAGVSTLSALAAGAPNSVPVVDAGRREVFTLVAEEPRGLPPERLRLEAGTVCVGDGAVRYRGVLEAAGLSVPPDGSDVHVPHARLHAGLAGAFGAHERGCHDPSARDRGHFRDRRDRANRDARAVVAGDVLG